MSKKSQLKRIATGVEQLNIAGAAPRDSSRPNRRPNKRERLPIMGAVVLWFGRLGSPPHVKVAKRRAFPIRAYVGPNGGGKSLCMVNDLLPSLARGRRVLSTVRILDHRTGEPHPLWEPFNDFDQLLDAKHTSVAMDEVIGIANSRDSSRLAQPVQNVLVQLRRRDLDLSWTAPNWARADKIIREVTQAVTECRGYFPGRSTVDESTGEIVQWAPRRVFRFSTYDSIEFEEWTASKRDRLRPEIREWFKGPGSRAFASYDTHDAVSMVAHASEAGICEACGGVRRPKSCRCAPMVKPAEAAPPAIEPAEATPTPPALEDGDLAALEEGVHVHGPAFIPDAGTLIV